MCGEWILEIPTLLVRTWAAEEAVKLNTGNVSRHNGVPNLIASQSHFSVLPR